jgi:predicted outer membrane repeat protein
MYGTSPLTLVTNTTFENNLARKSGGAVFLDRVSMYSDSVDHYERFWMGEVVFRENRAVFGGAV